jgi:16S rRNA (adenine1518-N6/adenine1519-N6)-dimethyltransferase
MEKVKAKKHLGQHFLRDENIALKIVDAFMEAHNGKTILEVGPGMGVLTKYLLERLPEQVYVAEVDTESVKYLKEHYPILAPRILEEDFLQIDFNRLSTPVSVIGNFPYNISSQIVFHIIDQKDITPLMVGMFQREVAQRFVAIPRTKAYGILSVITQAYYDVEYLFTVNEGVFQPPPKVKSAVVRFKRKNTVLNCDEKLFLRVVKAGFNQRRKMLRNALSVLGSLDVLQQTPYLTQRAEELSLQDFEQLTVLLQNRT